MTKVQLYLFRRHAQPIQSIIKITSSKPNCTHLHTYSYISLWYLTLEEIERSRLLNSLLLLWILWNEYHLFIPHFLPLFHITDPVLNSFDARFDLFSEPLIVLYFMVTLNSPRLPFTKDNKGFVMESSSILCRFLKRFLWNIEFNIF